MKFRKKPVVIEAVRWMTDNWQEIADFCKGVFPYVEKQGYLVIPTLEGDMTCAPFDWIIKGVKGEFYPCKPDIFEQTYEPVTP